MLFCENCGQKINDTARFCSRCGSIVGANNIGKNSERKVFYDGVVKKCPNCGEILKTFETTCSSCGYELRGTRISNSVHEFTYRLENTKSEEQKISLISNFPIPNTKEDIFEFMILASTNIRGNFQTDVLVAWITKFEQCYEKAKLLFCNESDFIKFQSIYEQTRKQISRFNNTRIAKRIGGSLSKSSVSLPRAIVVLGWVISLLVLIPLGGVEDSAKGVGFQLILVMDLIVGSIFIPFVARVQSVLPSLIAVIGLIVSIAILFPLCGKSSAESAGYLLVLIVDIITSLIIFIRLFKRRKTED